MFVIIYTEIFHVNGALSGKDNETGKEAFSHLLKPNQDGMAMCTRATMLPGCLKKHTQVSKDL